VFYLGRDEVVFQKKAGKNGKCIPPLIPMKSFPFPRFDKTLQEFITL
jgi:hypothetical protein